MEKNNIYRYIIIFSLLLFLILSLTEGYFLYKLNQEKKDLKTDIDKKDKELKAVQEDLARLSHLDSIKKDDAEEKEDEEEVEPVVEERELNPTNHNFTYLFSSNDNPKEVFNEMKDEIETLDFPIVYPKNSKLDSNVVYSYADFYSEKNPEDYDFLVLETDFVKDGKKVSLMAGFYGWGATCGENSYEINTNLGKLHACVQEEVTNISYSDESIENAQGTSYLSIFTVSNEYSQEEVKSLMSELEIIK